jgi:hypothetical protein
MAIERARSVRGRGAAFTDEGARARLSSVACQTSGTPSASALNASHSSLSTMELRSAVAVSSLSVRARKAVSPRTAPGPSSTLCAPPAKPVARRRPEITTKSASAGWPVVISVSPREIETMCDSP